MTWALVIVSAIGSLFAFLFIRSAITNGRLKVEITELKKNVEIAKKQLDIAVNHPDTPASLAERMRNGTL